MSPLFPRVFSRFLLGMALGSAAAACLLTQQRNPGARVPGPAAKPRHREWYSDHQPGPDGRLNDEALADKASEDSFPASDPPARMGALVLGAPARARPRARARKKPAAELAGPEKRA